MRTPAPSPAAVALVLALALGAAGCGDDDGGASAADGGASEQTATTRQPLATVGPGVTQGDPEADAIVGVLDDYAHAVRARDVRRICAEQFSAELHERLKTLGATCESFLQDTVAKKAPGYAIAIQEIEIDGDRATVEGREGDDRGEQLLVKEDGRWRLTLPKAR